MNVSPLALARAARLEREKSLINFLRHKDWWEVPQDVGSPSLLRSLLARGVIQRRSSGRKLIDGGRTVPLYQYKLTER